jgi:chaperone required for assembly of F1-ATPase
MKRFYKGVSVGPSAHGGFSVLLDGRPVKTPGKAELTLPKPGMAELVAAEWRGPKCNPEKEDELDPSLMVLTKCANTAIDQVTGFETTVAGGLLDNLHDLLCYRAEAPDELVTRQSEAWDPMLDWAEMRYGARLKVGVGAAPIEQDRDALDRLRLHIEGQNAFVLTALHGAATILGSLVLALAILEEKLTAEEAYAVSRVDEEFQAERWGRDAIAEGRARMIGEELIALAGFLLAAK